MPKILEAIGRRGSDTEAIAAHVRREPAQIDELMAGLEAQPARIKFGCAKILRIIGELEPGLLYSYFDDFVRLLESKNKILQWQSLQILGRLAEVDTENKLEPILDRYLASITGRAMITAAHAIQGAAWIALARPDWADRIARQILKVRQARYGTDECRNVAIGHAIDSFSRFFQRLSNPAPVVAFVRTQLKNSRAPVRRKAAHFLATHSLAPANPAAPTGPRQRRGAARRPERAVPNRHRPSNARRRRQD